VSDITEEANDAQKREDHILHPRKQNTNYGWSRRRVVKWLVFESQQHERCVGQEMEQLPPVGAVIPAKNSSFPHHIEAADTTEK
jgi:hypothetical protein